MRSRSGLLTVCSALALAACGGGNGEQAEQEVTGPPIDAVVAQALAERSDEVAAMLDEGDNCGAQQQAGLLREELNAAIADKAIPVVYLEDLSGLVNEIRAGIPPCEPPPLPPPPTETHDGGDGDD